MWNIKNRLHFSDSLLEQAEKHPCIVSLPHNMKVFCRIKMYSNNEMISLFQIHNLKKQIISGSMLRMSEKKSLYVRSASGKNWLISASSGSDHLRFLPNVKRPLWKTYSCKIFLLRPPVAELWAFKVFLTYQNNSN